MDFTTNGDNKLPIESTLPLIVYGTIATALFFDFVSHSHDSANAIATVVGTRVLKPLQAVGSAAIGNFVGPFILVQLWEQQLAKVLYSQNFLLYLLFLQG